MTIPISRIRLGIALLFPVAGLRIGGVFITNASGQRLLGWDVPEIVIIGLGWVLVAIGAIGLWQLIPQLINPEVGVTWDEETVRIRVGTGPKREAKRENIERASVSPSLVDAVRLHTKEGPDLSVPTWLLDLPDGWDAETLARKLAG